MAHRYLRELLNEDQEPFVLNNFIHDRRRQLKRSVPRTHLRAKARKTISQNSRLPGSFCNNACFFPSHDSPDVMKSPIFDFSAPKSPCRNSDTLFVDIPASTAAFLLEAASRIQKGSKSESPNKSLSFGLLGSILKRISLRKRNQKRETEGVRVSMKDIPRRDSSERLTEQTRKSPDTVAGLEEKRLSEMGFPCSSTSRLSSVLSESNEEKTVDLETSTSRSEDSVEMEFLSKQRKNGDFTPSEKGFCSSPFRFSLNKNPSPGRRSPDYQSPASSPSRDKKDFTPCQKEFCLSPSRFSPDRRSPAFQSPTMSPSRHNEEVRKNEKGNSKDYEEEKEQFSPVSVLDPPFDDDDIEHEVEEQEDGEDDLELDPSFAIVQRAKQHLLEKLLRFERLAELDPIELEKRMMEDEEDEDDEHESDDQLSSLHDEKSDDGFVKEVLSVTNSFNSPKIQPDFKRLVLDFVAEEGRDEFTSEDKGNTAKKVCRRLELLKEVESNDINMMLELDLRRESNDWRKHQEQVQELTVQMELAIFGFLVEELSWELVCCHGQ